MAINFDTAPDTKPSGSADIPKGTYFAKIVSADMTQGKDTSKPMYVKMALDIKDMETNTPMGRIWDNLVESENQYITYKFKRLTKACGLNLTGEVELSDVAKLIVGKEIKVDITIQEEKDGNPKKSVIDIFSADVFYPLVEETENDFEFPDATPPASY